MRQYSSPSCIGCALSLPSCQSRSRHQLQQPHTSPRPLTLPTVCCTGLCAAAALVHGATLICCVLAGTANVTVQDVTYSGMGPVGNDGMCSPLSCRRSSTSKSADTASVLLDVWSAFHLAFTANEVRLKLYLCMPAWQQTTKLL